MCNNAHIMGDRRASASVTRAASPGGPKVTALFARTDVIGFERLEYELTPDAIELGLGAALPATFEIGKERGFGRGERI